MDMTQNTGKPVNDKSVPRKERPEVGHAVDGQRWNGSAWEPAGAEGVASIPSPRQPRHHHVAAPIVTYPRR
jgi:hypothetical protein